jgi:glutaredoxin
VTLYLFYYTTCPHCHAEQDFLQQIGPEYPSLEIKKYAVDTSQDNLTLMKRFAKAFSVPSTFGVPQTYIGNTVVTGYWDYNTHGKLIQGIIDNCTRTGCPDSYTIVQESESGKAVNTTFIEDDDVEYPIIGVVDAKSMPFQYVVALVVITALLLLLVWKLIKRILKLRRSS